MREREAGVLEEAREMEERAMQELGKAITGG